MTSYVPGAGVVGAFPSVTLEAIELRVISNLMQREAGNMNQDELSRLRNDQAFELGIVPPVVPGN
jgi:hypothetical protein